MARVQRLDETKMRKETLQAVEMATLEWGHWFNLHRLLEPIGNVPPLEAEAAYYPAI
jgi:hypothetical protein